MYPDIGLSTLLVFVKNPTTSFSLSTIFYTTDYESCLDYLLSFVYTIILKAFCQNDTFTLSHTSNLYCTFIITLVLIVQLRIQSVTYCFKFTEAFFVVLVCDYFVTVSKCI